MDRPLSTVQIVFIFATVLCCWFFITFLLNGAGHASPELTTHVGVTEPRVTEPPRQNTIQFGTDGRDGEHALISGYGRQYMTDDIDTYLPYGLRDMVAKFIGLPFILEWRGCTLAAVFPYPLDLGGELKYNFWPDGDKTLNYYQNAWPSEVRRWQSKNQPETLFYHHRAGELRSDAYNADKWKTVSLVVEQRYYDEKNAPQYRTLPITSVNVPDFRRALREAISSDLNIELLPFPRTNVFSKNEQYFLVRIDLLFLARNYFGDSYKMVSANGDPLGTNAKDKEDFESPNYIVAISYNERAKKWEFPRKSKFKKWILALGLSLN
eukprot:734452_1